MMKRHLAAAAIALGSLATIAGTAEAQAATIASPFHAGQWGVEAYAHVFGDGGVMRFFTPRTALVLDVAADQISTDANDATSTLQHTNSTMLNLSLGLRHHTMVAPKIASTFAGGVSVSTTRQRSEYEAPSGTSVSSYRANYAGGWVEFGGQYMVADRFAVGLAYDLIGRHISNTGTDQHGFEFATQFRPIRATLYF